MFNIPLVIGHRPTKIYFERPPHTRKMIRRDNRAIVAQVLPKITNYNVRSLMPKIRNVSLDMLERVSDLNFLTEIWQKEENRKHQKKLEELFELDGIEYISTPRPGGQRGGGAAIAVRPENFSISKLNIAIPRSVEVVWGLVRPKTPSRTCSTIIACCFYSPPKSRKNAVLIDHITITLQNLLNTHNNAGIIISGDRNNIEIASLLSVDPTLRQIVTLPTRGSRILDVIVTNLWRYYDEPQIIPPILPDKPGHGVPSDHSGVLANPLTSQHPLHSRSKTTKMIRPLPESLLDTFDAKLSSFNFSTMGGMKVDQMTEYFQSNIKNLLCETFPEKKIVISKQDKPWFNEQLRILKRQRMREYVRHGKTENYAQLRQKYDDKLKSEMLKYYAKIMAEVTEGRRGSSYPALKKLGRRPGDDTHANFQLPTHTALNLSTAQSAELVAAHFSSISQEYEPIQTASLPPNIQQYLANSDQDLVPRLTHTDVYNRIRKAKKPASQVPGDLPSKLVKFCARTLAPPVTTIFNSITHMGQFPSQWKIEHQLAIPKVTPPQSEEELRNISKTPFFSKVYESFIGGWLIPYIQPYLDPDQCGLRGKSITHYLIKLLHFIHSTLDMKKPHSVLAACIDLSKAFNRCDHSLVIQDLFDMHTPPWLLKILMSYLSGRSMFLTFNGATSSRKMLPGGGPQGAYLGGIIFIIKYNGALLRPPIPRNIPGPVNKSQSKSVKFVDDGTVAVSVNLKDCLVPDPIQRQRPLNFHERTLHILPPENNLLQHYLNDTEVFLKKNKMVLNKKKTNVISFTKSRKWDFPPELTFDNGEQLECVSETKLVGVIISDDLRWSQNTAYICQKARKKLWILHRLNKLGLSSDKLFDVYVKEIRSLLELAVPVWHSGLTKVQSADIERIQKIAFKLILKKNYLSYDLACKYFSTQTLHQRRIKLCKTFAEKNLKSEHSFFQRIPSRTNARHPSKVVKEFKCNFKRFYNSSLPYLSRLLNQ